MHPRSALSWGLLILLMLLGVGGLFATGVVPSRAERWLGGVALLAAVFLGFELGDRAAQSWTARQWWRFAATAVRLICLLLALSLIGLQIAPMWRNTENELLFPFIALIGLGAGLSERWGQFLQRRSR